MSNRLHATLGDELYAAWHSRAPVAPLSARPRRLSLDDAYRIQQRFIERRVERGESVVGKKIGVTSQAVQELVERSRRATESLLSTVRAEVRAQVKSLGLATKQEM